jgi:hypothetical protein
MDNIRLITPDNCTLSVSYDGMQLTFRASGQVVIEVTGITFKPIPIQPGDFAFELRGWDSGVMNEIAIKKPLNCKGSFSMDVGDWYKAPQSSSMEIAQTTVKSASRLMIPGGENSPQPERKHWRISAGVEG